MTRINRPGCQYYTDDWRCYKEVIPPDRHCIGKQGTHLIESDNANTRHRIGRFTRRCKIVSHSEEMINLTLKLLAYFQIPENFLQFRNSFLSILG